MGFWAVAWVRYHFGSLIRSNMSLKTFGFLDLAMVLGVHHSPRYTAVDLDILQRRHFDLPPSRNQNTATGRRVYPCPPEVLLGPPAPSYVPVLALVSAVIFMVLLRV